MRTRSLRLPDELLTAISVVGQTEHLDEAPAIRKLLRLGLETYVANLYAAGRLTLRETAQHLGLGLGDTVDLLRDRGVSGNLTASDVLESIERFTDASPGATAGPSARQLPRPQQVGRADAGAGPAEPEQLQADTGRAVAESTDRYGARKAGT